MKSIRFNQSPTAFMICQRQAASLSKTSPAPIPQEAETSRTGDRALREARKINALGTMGRLAVTNDELDFNPVISAATEPIRM